MIIFAVFSQGFEPVDDPVAVFLIILLIMLVVPLVFERLRLPGIVGPLTLFNPLPTLQGYF